MRTEVIKGLPNSAMSFYDLKRNVYVPSIWDELTAGMWKEFEFDNWLYNNTLTDLQLRQIKPLFNNIVPIPKGYYFDAESKELLERTFVCEPKAISKSDFLSHVESFFDSLKDKKIGVHLSGGLDSSIIIALLKYFGVPAVLVGLESKRYEFRTERTIQHIMAGYHQEAYLIDMDDYPFYSNLDKIPKQQTPNGWIKMIDASRAVAQELKKHNVDFVFTGQGGDSLFVDPVTPKDIPAFNVGSLFTFPEEEALLYKPLGIKCVSFYSFPFVINDIISLRMNEKQDVPKWWARKFFSDILPRELSEYCFSADFFGHSLSGLQEAKPTYFSLFEEAYQRTSNAAFHPQEIKKMKNMDVLDLEFSGYMSLCSKISYAAWIHSLFRDFDNSIDLC